MRMTSINPLRWFKVNEGWVKTYCPNCGSLFFEVSKEFKRKTVRVKCRRCKGMFDV